MDKHYHSTEWVTTQIKCACILMASDEQDVEVWLTWAALKMSSTLLCTWMVG